MSDRLSALRLFVRIARTGNFSRAGRELGLSQPSASRIAAELEREVGAVLLTRTTRGVTLTEAGADYLARIEPLLAALEEADHAARGTGELRGTLRVAVSSNFGVREVIPRLPAFMLRHPALRIDLLMDDRRHDLVNESVDVALRWGVLEDSSAMARRLAVSPRLLAASPSYLARAGSPDTPESLADHDVIVGPLGEGLNWRSFKRDGRSKSVPFAGRLTVSSRQGAIAAAVAGLGIVSTGFLFCRPELASGALVQVLADWQIEPIELHAVFAAGRAAKPSARAFADYLAGALRELQEPKESVRSAPADRGPEVSATRRSPSRR
jgi:DNA-binding transcriptional LysR family regulator